MARCDAVSHITLTLTLVRNAAWPQQTYTVLALLEEYVNWRIQNMYCIHTNIFISFLCISKHEVLYIEHLRLPSTYSIWSRSTCSHFQVDLECIKAKHALICMGKYFFVHAISDFVCMYGILFVSILHTFVGLIIPGLALVSCEGNV